MVSESDTKYCIHCIHYHIYPYTCSAPGLTRGLYKSQVTGALIAAKLPDTIDMEEWRISICQGNHWQQRPSHMYRGEGTSVPGGSKVSSNHPSVKKLSKLGMDDLI